MSIRQKTVYTVLGVTLAFSAVSYFVQRWITLPGFAEVERSEALDDLVRCQEAIKHDASFLSNYANDYGAWDDTYEFIANDNDEYKSENLIPETFANLKVNIVAFLRKDGTLLWGEIRREEGKELVESHKQESGLLRSFARSDHELLDHSSPDSKVYGILMTSMGPLLVGSAPITTSDRTGDVRGAVVMGRFLSDELIQELIERTRVPLVLKPIVDADDAEKTVLETLARAKGTWIDSSSASVLQGYALIPDVFDTPALLLRAELPRSISMRGRAAVSLAAGISIGAGFCLVIVLWWILSRIIVRPLLQVADHALRIGKYDDLESRLHLESKDEIGVLAREFDRMVDRLAESRAQLLAVAHNAGKAQVAQNVLHNVGNVLNSVGVSASSLKRQIEKSEAGSLSVVSNLLQENRQNLGEFLTQNDRGKRIPDFVTALAEQIDAEQKAMNEELQTLAQAIEHIRHIVEAQQENARHKALTEMCDPKSAIEQSIELCSESLQRHRVDVQRRLSEVGAIRLDKHRLVQVLVNLITNSIQAIKATGRGGGQIVIAMSGGAASGDDAVKILVKDDGAGIAPENRERVFEFGFTTRPDGQGIGLHSAVNMAREMGGRLELDAKQPTNGAVFELVIPRIKQEVPV